MYKYKDIKFNMKNANIIPEKERVIAYNDGFNLYFGLIESGLDYCKWLDLKKLATRLLKPDQELIELKYFTSRINNDPDKQKRQNIYIEAVESIGAEIYYGNFQKKPVECKHCGKIWSDYKEKMTDVNIATYMLIDAYQDAYDMAMLISGDSDLVPPIRAIHKLFPEKRVFVAFPPKRYNDSLVYIAKGSMVIGRNNLVESQFDEEVTNKKGYILRKPVEWN
jgi:uncharacterized LabA/DUF88 family protein